MKTHQPKTKSAGNPTLGDVFKTFPKSCRGLIKFPRRWGTGYIEEAPDGTQAIQDYILRSAETILSLNSQLVTIHKVATIILTALQNNHKLLTAGNGGSAAEAMHLAEELTGKYCHPRKALPAICLNADPTALTCIANDWDFASVFSRQVEAFGQPGDVFVGFSTSGNSENILRAFATAKARGVLTIGLLGKDGGKAGKEGICDLPLIVASPKGNHVQEAHQAILHLILEHIDSVITT